MSAPWSSPPLPGAWDYRSRAIVAGGAALDGMAPEQRAGALDRLREHIRAQASALDDNRLVAVSTFMVDDLYKSYFHGFRWTPGVADYIGATAGTFTDVLTGRGFVLNYVVDNTVGDAHLEPLLTYMPAIFGQAGLLTVGPQLLALRVLEHDGVGGGVSALRTALAEGHYLAEQLVLRCHRERRSYVYLNIEFDDGTPGLPLRTALAQREAERTIVVFRNEPPIVGSELIVVPPPGITLPR